MADEETKGHSSHFLENKTIVVAGAGLAGSAFVVGLQKLWNPKLNPPTIIIFERDAPEIAVQRDLYFISDRIRQLRRPCCVEEPRFA